MAHRNHAFRRVGMVFGVDQTTVSETLKRLDSEMAELSIVADGVGFTEFDRSDANIICPAVDVHAFKWTHDLPKCTDRHLLWKKSDEAIAQLISLFSDHGLNPLGRRNR